MFLFFFLPLLPIGLIQYFNQSTGILTFFVEGFINVIAAPLVQLFM